MDRYLTITKSSFMAGLIYRMHFFFNFLGSLLFIIITYYLWKSIYANSTGTLNGMSFNQTFAYLSIATAVSSLFRTWLDWEMSRRVIDGSIVMTLIKPLSFQMYIFFDNLGFMLNNLVAVTLPSIVIVFLIFKISIPVGINILFFVVSIALTVLISFVFDYIVGLVSFYTESIWGVSTTKDVIIMLLSGMVIPLNFYPHAIRQVLMFLPFQAMYNVPMTILTSNGLDITDYIGYIMVQVFWIVVLFAASRLFYSRAIRVITVNGG